MIEETSNKLWQAEARTQETKQLIRDVRRNTRRRFTAEEKIRIVLEGFRRDIPIRDLCRREGIRPSTYYAWLKGLSLQSTVVNPLSTWQSTLHNYTKLNPSHHV